jgi:cell division protein FtsL
MKRSPIIPLFIGVHLLCMVLQIYKHSLFVQASYTKQKYEHERETLTQEKQQLTQELQVLKNRSSIQKYAQTKLQMGTLRLKQIKRLNDHEEKL